MKKKSTIFIAIISFAMGISLSYQLENRFDVTEIYQVSTSSINQQSEKKFRDSVQQFIDQLNIRKIASRKFMAGWVRKELRKVKGWKNQDSESRDYLKTLKNSDIRFEIISIDKKIKRVLLVYTDKTYP